MGDITTLFEPALRGDPRAQAELIALTQPELRKLALRWVGRYGAGDRVHAEELLGEAFLRLVPPPRVLLINALLENEGTAEALQGSGGEPDQVRQILDRAARTEATARRIEELGEDP